MEVVQRILNNQFELNDSMRSYDEISYVNSAVKTDKKGKYKEKVSYSQYKGATEYPDNGIVGYTVEKIYEVCEHKETELFGTFHKCKQCNELIVK